MILDQRIGHEYIAADLAAPSDGVLHAFDITDFVQMLALDVYKRQTQTSPGLCRAARYHAASFTRFCGTARPVYS